MNAFMLSSLKTSVSRDSPWYYQSNYTKVEHFVMWLSKTTIKLNGLILEQAKLVLFYCVRNLA